MENNRVELNRQFCQMLKGGVIMDVTTPEQAKIAEAAGACAVMALERIPADIRAAGGVVECYGAPTFPGAMFMLAHVGEVPVLGLPGCVMYHKASIFDLIVPRLLAGVKVGAADIAALGHGGYCAGCGECRYPVCPFGKN